MATTTRARAARWRAAHVEDAFARATAVGACARASMTRRRLRK